MTVLNIKNLGKSYGATVALKKVSFDVQPGEIHALLGENGAGKSTFVKIISGIIRPDKGSLQLNGKPYQPSSLMDARKSGVSTAFQELSLLPNLTVAENLSLPTAKKGRFGLNSRRLNEEKAAHVLAQYRAADISPRALVCDLSLAQRQRVEIVRAISHKPELLLLDEPTAALAEPEWLFGLMDDLLADDIAALYISHRLSEVRRLCKRGTVLRNGESVATLDLASTPDSDIFQAMVGAGNNIHAQSAPRQAKPIGKTAVEVKGLTGKTIDNIDFKVGASEIVGVAALEGQGQRELFRILGGVQQPISGTIMVDGQVVSFRNPRDALTKASGIGFIPEERKTEGIFLSQTTQANSTLSILDKISALGVVQARRERAALSGEIDRVQLSPTVLDRPISALSGGNQQKALILRVLLSGASNLVMFDPTRGVDVGTKEVIYSVIRQFAETGGSVLIYSTELSELVSVTDRCLVLYRGEIAGEVSGSRLNEETLVAYATGHPPQCDMELALK
ncbi:sugar ABC transporter ATP-binding protein [Pseudosulfitobacter sp. RP-4]